MALKDSSRLADLHAALLERAREQERERAEAAARRAEEERRAGEFRSEMEALGVAPLRRHPRAAHPKAAPEPVARQRALDDAAVLRESVSDEIDVDSLLETDETLSYRRSGIGIDVVRRLRRGHWSLQGEIDLHGLRVDEAREALGGFLRDALKHQLRCVRVVHGKGLGSKDRQPVLKGKVRAWLVQREEVVAFVQARPADGGSGALIVLLAPHHRSPHSR